MCCTSGSGGTVPPIPAMTSSAVTAWGRPTAMRSAEVVKLLLPKKARASLGGDAAVEERAQRAERAQNPRRGSPSAPSRRWRAESAPWRQRTA
ncbi:MAG: hypothetical protein ACLTGT_03845 [Oscillospiraceae bacterium]